MYCKYYGLKEEPFNITPDPAFVLLTRKHEEAFISLLCGIKRRKGFMVLTGAIGAGKTTLYRMLLNRLGSEVKSALIINPSLSPTQLLQTIIEDFEIQVEKKNRKGYFDALNRFLMEVGNRGETSILILDEAQDLKPSTLEQIRLLSNFETNKKKLLQIILVGQPELRDLLAKPSMAQIRQRITVSTHLDPLNREETAKYIAHRIEVAGGRGMMIFDSATVDEIFRYSKGVPRLINILCDNALLMNHMKNTGQEGRALLEAAEPDPEAPQKPPIL